MKPIPAVGLASALAQISDFSINVLRKDHPIHQTTDLSSTPVENATVLQNIINNIYRLTDLIDNSELKKLHSEKIEQKKSAKLSEAAQQLLKLSDIIKETVEELRDALIAAQARGSFGDPKWGTARDALMNGVWKKKEVTGTKKKFRNYRREVDTSLLLALRQYLEQSAETGLPVFAEESVGLRHWEKWQNEALDAIHANEWKPNKKKNVEEFGKVVDKLVVMEQEAWFLERVFAGLWFEELDDRLNSIGRKAEGTLEWVFGHEMSEKGGLLDWLGGTGQGMFWVTGKPGSGKTTLLHHIFRNPQIFTHLEAWSGASPGIASAFFFSASGTALQNSATGLLRSILYESLQDMIYGPLTQDQGIIQWLFADRWNQFTSYGGGLHDFAFTDLRKAFELMISDVGKKFLFMIDGLDELDEYPSELVELILSATKKDHVKICVSSRPSPVFLTAFEKRPHLVMDQWTRNDVQAKILQTFSQDERLVPLRQKEDNMEEMNIVSLLVDKAAGVFLYAQLATSYLLQATTDEESFTKLRDRAEALPLSLDYLLPTILDNLHPSEADQLWRVTTLLESHAYPGLLPLSFALTSDTNATIAADVRPLRSAECTKRIDEIRDILTHACQSLFSIIDTSPPDQTGTDPNNLRVTYTHRTIQDFLTSQPATKRTTLPPTYATEQWANAHLWTLKTLQPTSNSENLRIWPSLSACLEFSLLLHQATGKLQMTYLTEVAAATMQQYQKSPPGTSDLPCFPSTSATTLESFLDIAVWLNLQGYVALKAKAAERKEVRHAIDFSREMKKRLGAGGEERWLGGSKTVGKGDGKEKLRELYARNRVEVDGLLEYYGKAVRFGTAKPFLEVPEYV